MILGPFTRRDASTKKEIGNKKCISISLDGDLGAALTVCPSN